MSCFEKNIPETINSTFVFFFPLISFSRKWKKDILIQCIFSRSSIKYFSYRDISVLSHVRDEICVLQVWCWECSVHIRGGLSTCRDTRTHTSSPQRLSTHSRYLGWTVLIIQPQRPGLVSSHHNLSPHNTRAGNKITKISQNILGMPLLKAYFFSY